MNTIFYTPSHFASLIIKFYFATVFRDNKIPGRLHGYTCRCVIRARSLVAGIAVAAGMMFVNPLIAQPTFTQRTGVNDPLNDVGSNGDLNGAYPKPVFQNIDGNGTQDAIIGDLYGAVHYFKNTGTVTVPVFVEQTGINNPFNAIAVSSFVEPAFVDIDNDGDPDAFFGACLEITRLI